MAQLLFGQPTQQDVTDAAKSASPMTQDELIQQLLASYSQSVQDQRSAISDAESRLKSSLQSKEQINLAPLAALVDSWTGSRLAPYYKAPESNQKRIEELQGAILKAKTGLSDTEWQALKGMLGMEKQDKYLASQENIAGIKAAGSAEKSGTSDDRKDAQVRLGQKKEYNKEFGETISGIIDVAGAAEKIKSILSETGKIPTSPSDPRRDEYLSAVSQMITGYNRDVAKLGALAGGDLQLLIKATGVTTDTFDNYFKNIFGSRKAAGTVRVLDDMLDRADKKMSEYEQYVPVRYEGHADDVFKVQKDAYSKTRKRNQLQSEDVKPKIIDQEGHTYELDEATGEYK